MKANPQRMLRRIAEIAHPPRINLPPHRTPVSLIQKLGLD
jgi:hypothetical protein